MKNDSPQKYTVKVLDIEQPLKADLTVTADGSLSISGMEFYATDVPNVYTTSLNSKNIPVFIEFDGISEVKVSLRGYSYECKVQTDHLQSLLNVLASSPLASNRIVKVTSPMPGLLKSINTAKGNSVKKSETLFVLEAMKMENAIKSPITGVIEHLSVREGEAYEKGAVLCEISPA
ncbi:MAG: acetyl-CoA carboxylase biotin carboxyl carrier protein subunit [Ignavibacteria bacterium]|nr:acetyl-CoA carboxylase biotin carboxyl carrier protein subunit [Ignavibacteria bacterium]